MPNERGEAFETLRSAAELLLARPRDAAERILGTAKAITFDFSITVSPTWGTDALFAGKSVRLLGDPAE